MRKKGIKHMRTVYITNDGRSFDDINDAAKHEALIKEGGIERLKNNLATHLSNKSKLKAGHLRRDMERLDAAWEEWRKAISACKNRFDFHSSEKCKAIYDALFHLETAATRYHCDIKKLKDARRDIPQISKILNGVAEVQEKGVPISMDMIPAELLQEVKQVSWW